MATATKQKKQRPNINEKSDEEIKAELDNFEARLQNLKDERGAVGKKFDKLWKELDDAGYSKKVFNDYLDRKHIPIERRKAHEW